MLFVVLATLLSLLGLVGAVDLPNPTGEYALALVGGRVQGKGQTQKQSFC